MAPDNGVTQTVPKDSEQEQPLSPERLDSWKEIAAYLKRSVRTVRRWEAQEGLPVHRHRHLSSGTVYAFGPELDAWLSSRRDQVVTRPSSSTEVVNTDDHPKSIGLRHGILLTVAVILIALVPTFTVWQFRSSTQAKAESKPVNAEAAQLYYLGLAAASAQTYEGVKNGITLCQRATEKQPDFAEAYARIGLLYFQFSFMGPLAPREFMPQAEAAARKAVKLDESLEEAHRVLAQVLFRARWDWSGSEREFRRALALRADYAEGHRAFSVFLATMGRSREAISEAERARELDSLSLQSILNLGLAYRAAGDYDRAIAEFRRGVEREPNRSRAHFNLGATYVQKGLLNEGIDELENAVTLSPDIIRVTGYLAYSYAKAGRRTDAQKILDKLLVTATHEYVSPLAIARIYTSLGNEDEALAWLERAYQERDIDLVAPDTNPELADFRSNPHFRKVLARVGSNHQ